MDNIQTTTDYDSFKYLKGNRPVNTAHVKSLTKSISQSNLLAYNPIIVNDKMEIIDGQHRLEVAKQLGTPVSYVIAPAANLEDVTLLNNNLKVWGMDRWVESYIDRGYPEYLKLKEFKEKYDFAYVPCAVLLKGLARAQGKTNQELREGNFTITHKDWGNETAEKIIQMTPYLWIQTKSRARTHIAGFDRALVMALATAFKVITSENLIKKLKAQNKLIERRSGRVDYLLEIEEIYNQDETKPVRLV